MSDDYIQNIIDVIATATDDKLIYFFAYIGAVGWVRHEIWVALLNEMDRRGIVIPQYQPYRKTDPDEAREQVAKISDEIYEIPTRNRYE